MSDKYIENAMAEINKCQHYAIKQLAENMITNERILYIGLLAEKINAVEKPKNISQKIKELREAKGL